MQRLWTHGENAELRKISVARNRDGIGHIERAVSMITNVVANGPTPAGNDRTDSAIAQTGALINVFRGFGRETQRGHRGD